MKHAAGPAEASLHDLLTARGILPIITLDRIEAAIPLADALREAGLPLLELTMRTPVAAEAIRLLRAERPQMVVGAGTILTAASLESARASGAAFGVAPGFNPQVVGQARQAMFPFIPGIATPSEMETAIAAGCRLLKFFPAEPLGGPAMLRALAGPYAQTGARFLPTGGVTSGNLESYLRISMVAAAGGGWLATHEDLALGKWQDIGRKCREALAIVARVRGGL